MQAWSGIVADHRAAAKKLEGLALAIRCQPQTAAQAFIMQRMATACQKEPHKAYQVACFVRWSELTQVSTVCHHFHSLLARKCYTFMGEVAELLRNHSKC